MHAESFFKMFAKDDYNIFDYQNDEQFKITKNKIFKAIIFTDL